MADSRVMRRVRLLRRAKALLLRSGAARALAPAADAVLRVAYLAKLDAWMRAHADVPFRASGGAVAHARRTDLYDHLLHEHGLDGPVEFWEFGVASGVSLRWWLAANTHPESRFVGFDTFDGLAEDFGPVHAGTFARGGVPPDVDDDRASFRVGFFQDTLGPFLAEHGREHAGEHAREHGRRLVVHLDADLYASTLFVLTRLAPVLRPGTLLLFDEFAVPLHEFKAFTEFAHAYDVRVRVVGEANRWMQMAAVVEHAAA